MAVRQERVDTADDGAAELDALNQIRLSRNWSYQQLSDDMARVNHAVPAKTLHALLANRPKPYDRTLYQIREYLRVREAVA